MQSAVFEQNLNFSESIIWIQLRSTEACMKGIDYFIGVLNPAEVYMRVNTSYIGFNNYKCTIHKIKVHVWGKRTRWKICLSTFNNKVIILSQNQFDDGVISNIKLSHISWCYTPHLCNTITFLSYSTCINTIGGLESQDFSIFST